MKIPARFWTETIPHLTDVAAMALLSGLHRAPDDLPVGVIAAGEESLLETRWNWAAHQVAGELAAAPGITVDSGSGLAVVWEVATAELPRGPNPATGWARRIIACQTSWAQELAKRIGSKMEPSTRAVFEAEIRKLGWPRFRVSAMRPRPRADPFELDLQAAKVLEHQLRAGFDNLDDLGQKPGLMDRRAFIRALSAGYSSEDILSALRGRADKCRRSRRWKDLDTAQAFLRLSWLGDELRRLEEAKRVGDSLMQDPSGIVAGAGGRRFMAGREIIE